MGLEWTFSSPGSSVFLQDALGCVQDEWLLLPQEELLAACGNPGWQTPVHSHGAPGPRASAGMWEPLCVGRGRGAWGICMDTS